MSRTTRTTRTIAVLAALALAASLGAGCAKTVESPKAATPDAASAETAYPLTVTDDASRTVTVDAQPQRIVSLAPGNTEILFALGLGERVVGVTSYDNFPAEVADIAKVGDFAGPNVEAVAAADPDIVLVTTGVQADVVTKLEELGATVVAIDPSTLEALYADIDKIAAMANVSEKGDALVSNMQRQIASIQKSVAGKEPVTAFVEIGQNPLYTVGSGTLIDELVTLAGGKNVVTEAGYVPYSVEQLVKSDPAVYLATKSSATDLASVEKRAGYAGLSAVKGGRVVILDDDLVSRPGPRIVEGLKQLAEGLQGDK